MKLGSLFTGIGGFDIAFQNSGFEIAWQVEIDSYANKILEKHWPNVKRFKDVRECGKQNLGAVDVITAGFPCTDLSVAGKRAGLREGTRSGLWIEAARIIGELRPRYVVVENVPGLLANHAMGRVLGDLAQMRYDAEWTIIPASAVGAPHLRERVWIIAYPQRGRQWIGQGENEEGKRQPGAYGHSDIPPLESSNVDSLRESQSQRGVQDERGRNHHGSEEVLSADHYSERRERFWKGEIRRVEAFSWCEDVGGVEDLQGRPDIPEPLVRRKNDGISRKLDKNNERLKCLGNSIVPQIAEWIAKRIIEYDKNW